ncbi:hypothetical protein ACKKBG_A30940 [Auxenochlorella protothecoides x Auxenochlorella symbiontica]
MQACRASPCLPSVQRVGVQWYNILQRSSCASLHHTLGVGSCATPERRGFCQASSSHRDGPAAALDRESQAPALRPDLHIVLVHPQIPQNTGSIARTCAATCVGLHLVGPMGFQISATKLKRAGLDYWDHVCMQVHDDIEAFLAFYESLPGPKRLIGYSKFAERHYAQDGLYGPGTWLVFGSETSGLPTMAVEAVNKDAGNSAMVKIPMQQQHVRSLNLATSVGIGVYEALRQLDGAVLPDVKNY